MTGTFRETTISPRWAANTVKWDSINNSRAKLQILSSMSRDSRIYTRSGFKTLEVAAPKRLQLMCGRSILRYKYKEVKHEERSIPSFPSNLMVIR